MKKFVYKYGILAVDFVAFICMYFVSSFMSNDFSFSQITTNFALFAILYSTIKVLFHIIFGDYNILWMYRTRNNYLRMVLVSVISNTAVALLYMILFFCHIRPIVFATMLGAFIIEFCYIFVSRYTVNVILENVYRKIDKSTEHKRTLIVGAGSCGSMILSEIGMNKEFAYDVVAFIDDSIDKIDTKVNNVKVYGPLSKINEVIEKHNIEEVIIAIPTASKEKTQEIVNSINYKGMSVHIVPQTSILLDGSISKSLRKVSINDLLGREQIQLDTTGLNAFLGNKTILVTGGGGSIGSEICRQVLKYGPKQLVVFDIYENTTYNLQMELDMFYRQHTEVKKPNYICLIGSVRDEKRLEEVFSKYHPNIIFHAAAHKHVPLMEDSPKESIKNNVVGTYNVAKMADKYGAEKMVLISTDKAVNPTNVMGASKRFCEMVVEAWNAHSEKTKYSMVRFGNVLGSNGSVIPLFEKQIQTGGPVTVTDERINRFFMTIPEACGLVIQSGAFAKGGEKFILDMGKPVNIIDLAKNMIKLSGLELDKDIKIEITGLRPGEKLYEELLLDYSKANKTKNEKIFVEECLHPLSMEEMDNVIKKLLSLQFIENKEILNYLDEIEDFKVERKKVMAN